MLGNNLARKRRSQTLGPKINLRTNKVQIGTIDEDDLAASQDKDRASHLTFLFQVETGETTLHDR